MKSSLVRETTRRKRESGSQADDWVFTTVTADTVTVTGLVTCNCHAQQQQRDKLRFTAALLAAADKRFLWYFS